MSIVIFHAYHLWDILHIVDVTVHARYIVPEPVHKTEVYFSLKLHYEYWVNISVHIAERVKLKTQTIFLELVRGSYGEGDRLL